MDMQITKKDGTSYRLSKYGIIATDFIIEGIEQESTYEDITGLHGRFFMGATYKTRTIKVPCHFQVKRLNEFPLQRDEMFDVVTDVEPFYIQEMRRIKEMGYKFKKPKKEDYVSKLDEYGNKTWIDEEQTENKLSTGKRYLVKLSNVIEPTQKKKACDFILEFETTELPFAESVYTSLDLHALGANYPTSPHWSYGMGLNYDVAQYNYKIEAGTLARFWYGGNVPNDQFNMYRKITFTFKGSVTDLVIQLNNDVVKQQSFTVTGLNASAGDKLVIDGANITLNGLSVLNKSNFNLFSFNYGWNTFSFNNSLIDTDIDIRFYYK